MSHTPDKQNPMHPRICQPYVPQRSTRPVLLTGDRPTGSLHLGHWVGSLKARVAFQTQYDSFIMVADGQALTDHFSQPDKVHDSVFHVVRDYVAVGLNPAECTIFVQSGIPELAELMFYYMNLVTIARLARNPTVKAEMQQKGFGTLGVSSHCHALDGRVTKPVTQKSTEHHAVVDRLNAVGSIPYDVTRHEGCAAQAHLQPTVDGQAPNAICVLSEKPKTDDSDQAPIHGKHDCHYSSPNSAGGSHRLDDHVQDQTLFSSSSGPDGISPGDIDNKDNDGAAVRHSVDGFMSGTEDPLCLDQPSFVAEEGTIAEYGASLPAGFLCYPISQAADITAFGDPARGAICVPVGDDQLPMIEQTNEIVRRFHHLYAPSGQLVLASARAHISSTSRLVGTDGHAKASKSRGNAIFLTDDPDVIRQKVFGMYTDPDHIHVYQPGKVQGNVVFAYLDAFYTDKTHLQELKAHYTRGGLGDVVLKKLLCEQLNAVLEPMRQRASHHTQADTIEILRQGTAHARQQAAQTLDRVKRALGILYF